MKDDPTFLVCSARERVSSWIHELRKQTHQLYRSIDPFLPNGLAVVSSSFLLPLRRYSRPFPRSIVIQHRNGHLHVVDLTDSLRAHVRSLDELRLHGRDGEGRR